MARNLRKFVNPRFMKTVDLRLLRRLFERQTAGPRAIDMTVFDGEQEADIRQTLQELFAGPETALPEGLVADLHRIAELGNENGLRVLLEQAERRGIVLAPAAEYGGEPVRLDPKHIALLAFLDHQAVFNEASDFLALETRETWTEFAGNDEAVDTRLDDFARHRFEQTAAELFSRDLQGHYCRVGWYEDDDEINVVVTHGKAVTITTVIEHEQERVISFQAAGRAMFAYQPLTGRLKVGGVPTARRRDFAEAFADGILGRPDFFSGADSQNLYTLAPIERHGLGFTVDRAFDPGIEKAQIVEVQVDRVSSDDDGNVRVHWSLLARDRRTEMDGRGNALARLGEMHRGLVFGPDGFRIGHVVLRLQFRNDGGRPTKVSVKIKPPGTAAFKRHRFEGRVMDVLRRNGFCHEREPGAAAAAAQ